MKAENLLKFIGSTEPSSFGEICGSMGDDKPSDKKEWAQFFRDIEDLENLGYIEVSRTQGKIDSVILTEQGAAVVRIN